MPEPGKTYLFRMMHIDNIPHVLQHGITHAQSANANTAYVPIGDSSLINTRNAFVLINGRKLGEYIPFYLAARTPMLYVVQKGFNWLPATPAQDIVYCISSVRKIIDCNLDFVFTNGHAVDRFTSQYSKADVDRMNDLLDWAAINEKFWKSDTDLDLKRRKEAEFLVQQDVPFSAVLGFVVFNQQAKDKLIQEGVKEKQIHIEPKYYF